MAHSVRVRRAGLAAAALASVFLLTACAPGGAPAEHYTGMPVTHAEGDAVDENPEGAEDAAEEGAEEAAEEPSDVPQVVWIREGEQLALTISGSSTCPVVGREIRVLESAEEGNRVAIDLVVRDENEICTMDFVPHTTVFWTPLDVTTTQPLVVDVAGESITVPIK